MKKKENERVKEIGAGRDRKRYKEKEIERIEEIRVG